jgi:prophage antirepressor-like protein
MTLVPENAGNIIPLNFEGGEVRVVAADGAQWWVGRDVCRSLGYVNDSQAMDDHCKGVSKRYPLSTAGGVQEVRVLSEPDVLRLIVGSRLPAAERFERWVFEEILPAIRRTGSYGVAAADARIDKMAMEIAYLADDCRKMLEFVEHSAVGIERLTEMVRALGKPSATDRARLPKAKPDIDPTASNEEKVLRHLLASYVQTGEEKSLRIEQIGRMLRDTPDNDMANAARSCGVGFGWNGGVFQVFIALGHPEIDEMFARTMWHKNWSALLQAHPLSLPGPTAEFGYQHGEFATVVIDW